MNYVKKNNYSLALDYSREKIKSLDPYNIAKLSNIIFNKDLSIFEINIMNNMFNMEYPSGKILEKSNSLELDIIITRYLSNAMGALPTNKFITFKEIPGGNVYYNNFLNRTIKRLAYEFSDCIDKYKTFMDNLGAEKVNMGDLAYKFNFIGNTFMIFIIWFEDDEFEANANILFDSNITYYFNTEDLAVVPDIAIDLISKGIKEQF
ncbi:DUF3786 domain-containing protein [Faecalimicrobium sp. JNUCC 81]